MDIVEKLRQLPQYIYMPSGVQGRLCMLGMMVSEAVDEITTLRQQLAESKKDAEQQNEDFNSAINHALTLGCEALTFYAAGERAIGTLVQSLILLFRMR